MARELPGGYELDDDRDRIDVDLVHRYLSVEAYWALGRSRQTVERLVREAVEHPSHRELTWSLTTRDAHGLDARFGFEEPNERTMVPLRQRD